LIVLAGNKVDLDNLRKVEHGTAASFAEKNDLMFFETSAKSAENVKEIYQSIAEKLKELHVPVQPTPKKSNCC